MTTQPAPLPAAPFPRLAAAGRWCAAVLLSAAVGTVVYLVMVQGSAHKGFTDLDFNHSLGVLIGGDAERETSHSALGVSGDTAAPTGLMWTFVFAVVLCAAYGLVMRRRGRPPWYLAALPFGIVVFLLVALVYMPIVGSRVDEATVRVLGIDGGGITPVVFLLSSLGFALVVARVYSLAVSASWWEPRAHDAEAALLEFEGGEALELGEPLSEDSMRASLELPEQRGEDGGVKPGR